MKFGDIFTDYYPVLLSKTHHIEVSERDCDEYFTRIDEVLSSTSGPYVFISLDEKDNQYFSAEMRIYLGKGSLKISEKYKERNLGSIVISKGLVKKMMIKAIAIVDKQFSDIIVVNTRFEAFERAKDILQKKNIRWTKPSELEINNLLSSKD